MSLINKLKNILFEEEEVEIPVLEKKEEPKSRVGEVKRNATINSFYDDTIPVKEEKKEEVKTISEEVNIPPKPVKMPESRNDNFEFKTDNTFNFPAFDEEEFEKATPKPRSTNVLEYERKKSEKKQEVKKETIKPKKKEEPKDDSKFRPSPIISPVYGILDKNYTPDEITSRRISFSDNKALDVDSVRKKAFGPFEEEKYSNSKIELPTENVKFDDHILEEKMAKARTIDELLQDSSDEVIPVSEDTLSDLNIPITNSMNEDNIDSLTITNISDASAIPDNYNELVDTSNYENDNKTLEDITPNHVENLEDDTLESDLFDLIDSMYENREDGE